MKAKDFFISYTGHDRAWAEWVAWVLEAAGYSVVIQAWDFRVGGNFVLDMQRATIESKRTIAILSALYLDKSFPQPEWSAAFAQDPTSQERKLIPIRVEDCNPPGLLQQMVYTDVFNCDEAEAQQRLLSAVQDGRMKPEQKPNFPNQSAEQHRPDRVLFPGTTLAKHNAAPIPTPPAPKPLTRAQKRHLEDSQQRLEIDYNLRAQRLREMRKTLAITTEVTSKFQLQQQIQEEEAHLTTLTDELDSLERSLSS